MHLSYFAEEINSYVLWMYASTLQLYHQPLVLAK